MDDELFIPLFLEFTKNYLRAVSSFKNSRIIHFHQELYEIETNMKKLFKKLILSFIKSFILHKTFIANRLEEFDNLLADISAMVYKIYPNRNPSAKIIYNNHN